MSVHCTASVSVTQYCERAMGGGGEGGRNKNQTRVTDVGDGVFRVLLTGPLFSAL